METLNLGSETKRGLLEAGLRLQLTPHIPLFVPFCCFWKSLGHGAGDIFLCGLHACRWLPCDPSMFIGTHFLQPCCVCSCSQCAPQEWQEYVDGHAEGCMKAPETFSVLKFPNCLYLMPRSSSSCLVKVLDRYMTFGKIGVLGPKQVVCRCCARF